MATRYFAIRNFERFQHYSNRKPPWIKLYRDLWRDREFFRLSDKSKLVFIGLTTIASICDNLIPEDFGWLSTELSLSIKEADIKPLFSAGFLSVVQDASEMLAERTQPAMLEESREEKIDPQNSKKNSSDLAPSQPQTVAQSWGNDEWIKKFLQEEQTAFNGNLLPKLIHHDFWCDVSEATNGISPPFLQREFAKMAIWVRENPRRAPTTRIRQFVASWLERAYEKERRHGTAN